MWCSCIKNVIFIFLYVEVSKQEFSINAFYLIISSILDFHVLIWRRPFVSVINTPKSVVVIFKISRLISEF